MGSSINIIHGLKFSSVQKQVSKSVLMQQPSNT